MPNLVAYDLAGVQPMNGPTGLIFAMRARYEDQAGAEALFNEPDTAYSGQGDQFNHGLGDYTRNPGNGAAVGLGTTAQAAGDNPGLLNPNGTETDYNVGQGMATADAENLGNGDGNQFNDCLLYTSDAADE